MKTALGFAGLFSLLLNTVPAATPELRDVVAAKVRAEFPSLEAMYKQLHANPELSFR